MCRSISSIRPRSRSCRANRGREDLEVLAAGSLEPDPDCLGHIAAQEGHAVGGLRVFGMVGEDERPCQAPP